MSLIFNLFEGMLDMIYPKELTCLFCNKQSKDMNELQLCSYCISILPYLSENICKKCGRPVHDDDKDNLCSECKENEIYFNNGTSVFEFTGIIQDALYRLKFDGEKNIALPVGKLMAHRLKQMKWQIDIIVPVPLHEKRISDRGFNQSTLLASEIGRECSINVSEDILLRQRNTESQVYLSKYQRIHNVKDAFTIKSDANLRRKSILLIDDIMTTGATLNECSRVLRKFDAGSIYCITAACPFHAK